jgi:AcrR family transcriptional regulator
MTAARRPAARAGEPRWRRLEPDARREQILDAAIRLFGERPYAAVSTADIAGAAGVARGLLNHYFGTKRDLYLAVVRRMVLLPDVETEIDVSGTLEQRVAMSVDWFLDTVAAHGKTFVAVIGAEGVGTDPEVEQILAEADNIAARKVLATVGLPDADEAGRALIRSYGGMVKAAVREWLRDGSLQRADVQLLLTRVLLAIARDVAPKVPIVNKPTAVRD